jgi:hypothetical protein
MRVPSIGAFVAYLTLCSLAGAAQSMEEISHAVAAATAIQVDLAMAQKHFSIMSRGMAETERCAARELLDASTVFWEITEEARKVGQILGEMKSVDDQNIIRRHFGDSAHLVVSIGENDIQLVNDFLTSITNPEAKAAALGIRDKMIEVRDVLKPFASATW